LFVLKINGVRVSISGLKSTIFVRFKFFVVWFGLDEKGEPCKKISHYAPNVNFCFCSVAEMPQPLLQICKVHLRKQLACHWDRIHDLPLPVALKAFLGNGF